MSSSIADYYVNLFSDDGPALLALLTCSAALHLDDETAGEIVDLIAKSGDSTPSLVSRVKKLDCVTKESNGVWYVTEDVRRRLHGRLYRQVSKPAILQLREHLAHKAAGRAAQIDLQGRVLTHHELVTRLEPCYQRLLTRAQREIAANDLVELWRRLPPASAEALVLLVDGLAPEVIQVQRSRRLPDGVVFLRGIAAQTRGDDHAQEKHFLEVWRGAPSAQA